MDNVHAAVTAVTEGSVGIPKLALSQLASVLVTTAACRSAWATKPALNRSTAASSIDVLTYVS